MRTAHTAQCAPLDTRVRDSQRGIRCRASPFAHRRRTNTQPTHANTHSYEGGAYTTTSTACFACCRSRVHPMVAGARASPQRHCSRRAAAPMRPSRPPTLLATAFAVLLCLSTVHAQFAPVTWLTPPGTSPKRGACSKGMRCNDHARCDAREEAPDGGRGERQYDRCSRSNRALSARAHAGDAHARGEWHLASSALLRPACTSLQRRPSMSGIRILWQHSQRDSQLRRRR
jgi:hypothetical protein